MAMKTFKRVLVVFSSCLLLVAALPRVAGAKIVTEVIDLPVKVVDIKGRRFEHKIKVTIIRDNTRAKSSFMIMNHGRGVNAEINRKRSVKPYFDNARYFVSKGYAVFLPLRVGYGVTGGPDVEYSGSCADRHYGPVYEAGAVQTVATIAYAKALSYIDPADGIVIGQSFGGTIAAAVAAKNIPGVKAAVNFAGGGGGNPVTQPENPCRPDLLGALFAGYGATARIPTLWLYSVNDRYFGPKHPREWFQAFLDRGGHGTFVALPSYKQDGHPSFTGNPAAWKPAVEQFLASCCAARAAVSVPDPSAHSVSAPPLASPPPARAAEASPETLAVFTRVLEAWVAKHHIRQASIVVRHNGRIVHQAGLGEDPGAPVPIASLSKAITGTCIATLVRDGKLSFETPVSTALAKFIARHGRPADPRLGRVTISQLLTHRAGLASNDDGQDAASRTALDSYLATHSPREPAGPDYVRAVLASRLDREPGAKFAYSNADYLLLGAIIEEATGARYEDYCRAAVLAPTGASGTLDPDLAVLWAFGGWRMDGANYLAFYEIFDPRTSPLGPRAFEWMSNRSGKTYGRTKYPVWYGLGVRLRDRGQGLEVWHTGSWSRRLPTAVATSRDVNTSTLAFRSMTGLSLFVHSQPLVGGDARNELLDQLILAARSIKQWN